MSAAVGQLCERCEQRPAQPERRCFLCTACERLFDARWMSYPTATEAAALREERLAELRGRGFARGDVALVGGGGKPSF